MGGVQQIRPSAPSELPASLERHLVVAFRSLPRADADNVAVVDFQLDDAQRVWVAEVRQSLGEYVTAALRAEMAEHQATRSTRFRSRRNE